MKPIPITVYEAFDGKRFLTAQECTSYEEANIASRLVALTIEQVRAALSREDPELAEVIEELGTRLAKARREAGDLKRKPKGSAAAEAAAKAEPEAPISPYDRGREDAKAGRPEVIPADICGDSDAEDAYLNGYQDEGDGVPAAKAA